MSSNLSFICFSLVSLCFLLWFLRFCFRDFYQKCWLMVVCWNYFWNFYEKGVGFFFNSKPEIVARENFMFFFYFSLWATSNFFICCGFLLAEFGSLLAHDDLGVLKQNFEPYCGSCPNWELSEWFFKFLLVFLWIFIWLLSYVLVKKIF